jgi:hypothetical protein
MLLVDFEFMVVLSSELARQEPGGPGGRLRSDAVPRAAG